MRTSRTSGPKRFCTDRRGNFAVVFAAASAVIMLGVGFGLNTLQMITVKSNLLNALDSAITSTARDLTTGIIEEKDARESVEAFLLANGGTAFAVVADVVLETVDVDRNRGIVSAAAAAAAGVDVDLLFPLFSIGERQHVTVESAARYSDRDIEVAMMLDVTGSMQGRKIRDLQVAARNAVKTFLKGRKRDRVRVALVPYAEAVNTGGLRDTVFVEKKGGSDVPPPEDKPLAVSTKKRPDDCATERKLLDGSADFSDDGPFEPRKNEDGEIYPAKVNRDDRISTDWRGNTMCPDARLIPLTTDMDALLDSIDDFRAQGVTAGGVAVQWSYYMLSPKWREAIANAGLGGGPADHDEKKVAKIAILMTDGQFNTAFAGVDEDDEPQLRQGRKSRRYAENICRNMKRDGIEIFAIGFDLKGQREAQEVLRNCASEDTPSITHYYEAADGEELDWAFQEVARNVERLAIIK